MFKGTLSVSMCSVLALIAPSESLAQPVSSPPSDTVDQSSDAADSTASEGTIGEIVVTAQKRSESLQRTPVAVSAFNSDTLEARQISGVEQLQFNVPSLVFAELVGFSQLSLRGIGSDLTTTAGEPTVATFQDGVYVGQLFSQSVPSFDLERVEVLRGPQGTLYGRNSTGGAINYITRAPSYEAGGNLAVQYGSYDRALIEGGATGTIVPDLVAGRVTVKYDRRDGYRRNLFDGRDYDDNDQISAQAALLIEPSASLKATLRGDITRQKSSPVQQFVAGLPVASQVSPQTPVGIFSLPGPVLAAIPGLFSPADIARLGNGSVADLFGLARPGAAGPDPTESLDFQNDFAPRTRVDLRGTSATLDWNLGGAALKSITAYRYSKLRTSSDSDGTSAAIIYIDPILQTSKQFTQEFNLSGEGLDDRLDWLVGAFYLHDRSNVRSDIFVPSLGDLIVASGSFTSATPPPVFNLSQPFIPNLLQVIADPVFGRTLVGGIIPATAFLGFGTKQDSESIAGFGQATVAATDRLRLTAGLRYTHDTKEVSRTIHSNFIPAAALCDTESKRSWGAVTGTAGIDYDVAPRTLGYAKVSRGYKAGGFNPGECTGSFDPETIWAYEGGLKTTFAQGQVRVNTAAFYYDFQNIQFTTYNGNASTIKNAANAKLYGLEVESTIAPEALRGLTLDGSASYIHSRYGSQLLQDPLALATLDIGGNQLIRAPKWKVNLGAQYELQTASLGDFTLRGEGSYTSKVYHDVFNGEAPSQGATVEPGFWIANARLIWEPADTRFQAQLFVENIGNQLYAFSRAASATAAVIAGQFSAPRTFGVRLAMKLGSAK